MSNYGGVSARFLGGTTRHEPQTTNTGLQTRDLEQEVKLVSHWEAYNSGARTDTTVPISRILLVRKMGAIAG